MGVATNKATITPEKKRKEKKKKTTIIPITTMSQSEKIHEIITPPRRHQLSDNLISNSTTHRTQARTARWIHLDIPSDAFPVFPSDHLFDKKRDPTTHTLIIILLFPHLSASSLISFVMYPCPSLNPLPA